MSGKKAKEARKAFARAGSHAQSERSSLKVVEIDELSTVTAMAGGASLWVAEKLVTEEEGAVSLLMPELRPGSAPFEDNTVMARFRAGDFDALITDCGEPESDVELLEAKAEGDELYRVWIRLGSSSPGRWAIHSEKQVKEMSLEMYRLLDAMGARIPLNPDIDLGSRAGDAIRHINTSCESSSWDVRRAPIHA